MATITLKIAVAQLEDVREHFDKLKVYRSTTGASGPYTEITEPSTRVPLEAGRIVYEFTDDEGDADYFYRVSYFNSVTSQESSLSEPQQGEEDSALSVISVEEVKTNFLFGIDLTDDTGTPFPDSLYEFYIKSAVSFLEQKLDMPLRPTRYVDELHDYYQGDTRGGFTMFLLDHYPIIEIEKVALKLPGKGTTESEYDLENTSLHKESGQLMLQGGPKLRTDFVPDAFRMTYTAGFEKGKVPGNIRELVGKIASYGPLNIAGDLVGGAGLAGSSLSIDGLSQSITTTNSSTNAGFGARLLLYRKEVKDQIDTVLRYYKGLRLRVA